MKDQREMKDVFKKELPNKKWQYGKKKTVFTLCRQVRNWRENTDGKEK